MDQQELKDILELHRKWVMGEENGKRANLDGANLVGANLVEANLVEANLVGANLVEANLVGANLAGASLVGANLVEASLVGANLVGANLARASLVEASLARANLARANLARASLVGANLAEANLVGASLVGANLARANLVEASLVGANLARANFKLIIEDFNKRLLLAKDEIVGLYDALNKGKINGSVYEGPCACFCGTVANIRKEKYDGMKIDLRPDAESATEKWFLAIREGDIPQSSIIAKLTCEWIEAFAKEHSIELPSYKIISSLDFPEAFK